MTVISFPAPSRPIPGRGALTVEGEFVIPCAVRHGEVWVRRIKNGQTIYEWMPADRIFFREFVKLMAGDDRPCDSGDAA